MAEFWTIVEENTGICVPKYLKNILMLNGYDDVLSVQSITTKDIDLFEQFVKNEMENYIGVNGNPKDFYGHIFYDKKDKFQIVKGDRVKLMDAVGFVKTKLASEAEAHFYNQSEENLIPTSNERFYSRELAMHLIEDHVNVNQPTQIESEVPETCRDNAFIGESRATKRNRDASFCREDDSNDRGLGETSATKRNRGMNFSREDNSDDESLIVPLLINTSSLPPISSNDMMENVVDSIKDSEIRRRVQFLDMTKMCSEAMPNAKHVNKFTQRKDPLTLVSSSSSNKELPNLPDAAGIHKSKNLIIAEKEISPTSMPVSTSSVI